ncbi:hypothetical protein A2Y83_03955 [Candidatus Falkowbacteria bacterium RBG_13_39_14]|uniref:Protein-(Glutamine-N5) methyltransferase, release factor-specific n=1 Tax=Candidatus Falkowbacteria bacterium RBG_13_39_14 TaxID=1797985 RepID=A0A1F5S7U7_9BACT|nr:MAG: hypothetical protein A2Y83_03955 [Candidatus Falkowbacteria bacterium RBG_13_39_14]
MLANNNKNVKSHTIKSLLKWAFLALKEGSASPELDAEVILSFVIGKNREYLHTHPEKRIIGKREQKFKRLIGKRKKHEPVAYIIEKKEFYGIDFKVNKNVLIPRSETEMMVDEAVKIIGGGFSGDKTMEREEILEGEKKLEIGNWKLESGNSNYPIALIDIGTGSGCIPIAVAKNLIRIYGRQYASQHTHIFGIDISEKALKIARENARLNGVGRYIEFLHGDLLDVLSGRHKSKRERALVQVKKGGMPVVIITANLPYLPEAVYRKCAEDVKNYEPKEALVAGRDGLRYYRRLLRDAGRNMDDRLKRIFCHCEEPLCRALQRGDEAIPCREKMTTGLLSPRLRGRIGVFILCEIDPAQKRAIKILAKEYFSNARVEIKKDLCGLARLAVIRVPPSALRIQERGTQ